MNDRFLSGMSVARTWLQRLGRTHSGKCLQVPKHHQVVSSKGDPARHSAGPCDFVWGNAQPSFERSFTLVHTSYSQMFPLGVLCNRWLRQGDAKNWNSLRSELNMDIHLPSLTRIILLHQLKAPCNMLYILK